VRQKEAGFLLKEVLFPRNTEQGRKERRRMYINKRGAFFRPIARSLVSFER